MPFEGRVWWSGDKGSEATADRVSANRIIVRITHIDEKTERTEYELPLDRREGNEFEGRFTYEGHATPKGRATARLYEHGDGFALVGEWTEDDYPPHTWWVEFAPD